jgi:hypothetical protein
MEAIVRPFQTFPTISTARIVISKVKVKVDPAHLCWGAVGDLPKAIEQSDDFNGVNFRVEECDERLTETSRKTEHIRVEQAGKPQNFVIVERIREIDYNKTSKQQFSTAVQLDTANLQFPDFFAGTAFAANSERMSCRQKVYLAR